ncbi:MAG: acyl-CoA dehydrogenase domain protein [Planctomycetaceae bacterium]|nr:acyl-CoA dehydrogenase domain protein [Planctomycetaceae bacterium]
MPLNLQGIALDPVHAQWRRVAKDVATKLALDADRVDREGEYPTLGVNLLTSSGLTGLTVPKEKGGAGGNIKTAALVIEELAQGCASCATCYTMHLSSMTLMAALASEDQIERLLLPMMRCGRLNSVAMSEPGSGNRLWHTDSYAERLPSGYQIDSFKSFASSSGNAGHYIVPVRASNSVGPTDISLFVIDGTDPQVKPVGRWDGMGLRGSASTPVHFDKVLVPEGNRLGSETCGFSMLFAYTLPIYQVGLSAMYLGIAQAAYDTAVAHVKKRIHSDTGLSLSKLETVQRYIGEMRVRIDQSRHLIYRVAQMADNAVVLFNELAEADLLDEIIRANPDDPFFIEVAQVKVSASEMANDVVAKSFQVCGGSAYKRGHRVERCVRDVRASSVMAPSDDTLKLIIGRQILGIEQPWEG